MDRIQWALHKQLKGSYDVARMTLSEQTEELSRAKAAREDIGVQLYQMQQQLAKLQMNLEKVHENHSIIAQMREAAEDDQRKVREAYKGTYGEVSGQRQKVAKHQAELDQLAATLRQVEAYNEQMRSEIAVTRRATYKAEEAITQLEGGKVQQDVLIDAINEKLKRSQEQLALYEAQLLAQQQETGAAGNTLKEASAEMEAIHFEKKQLLSQWKTALIGMGRRDEALKATEEAIRKQREQELAIEQEQAAIKKDIRKEEEVNEYKTATVNRLGAEEAVVDQQIEAARAREASAQARPPPPSPPPPSPPATPHPPHLPLLPPFPPLFPAGAIGDARPLARADRSRADEGDARARRRRQRGAPARGAVGAREPPGERDRARGAQARERPADGGEGRAQRQGRGGEDAAGDGRPCLQPARHRRLSVTPYLTPRIPHFGST